MALSPRDKRALIILGAAAGVAVVAFVLLKVLGGGGGEEAASPTPVVTGGPTTAPSPTESPTPTPRETLPPVVVAGARDPFSVPPVLETQTPSGSVSPSTGPSGSPTTSPTGSPTTSPTETPTAPGGGSSTTVGGHTVVLVSIYSGGTKAQVEVDGKVYNVSEGGTFGDNFKLVSISGSCARFLYGDQSFTLCLNPQK
ncbi:MAG TPA: hypothetical protein VF382_00240 [Actinomycetota bacterium]